MSSVTDVEQAAFDYEGRKLVTSHWMGAKVGECLYRVDRIVKVHPRQGSDGTGRIEFDGQRAHRSYTVGDEVPEWIVDKGTRHVVTVGEITTIR